VTAKRPIVLLSSLVVRNVGAALPGFYVKNDLSLET